MSLIKVLTSTAVATSLLTAPVVAQAAVAEQARISTEVEGENLRGGFIVPLIAIIAIILGILAATSDNDDPPTSP